MKALLTALCLTVLATGFTANAATERTRGLQCLEAIDAVNHWAREVRKSENQMHHADRICGYSHRCRENLVRNFEFNRSQLHAAEYRRAEFCY